MKLTSVSSLGHLLLAIVQEEQLESVRLIVSHVGTGILAVAGLMKIVGHWVRVAGAWLVAGVVLVGEARGCWQWQCLQVVVGVARVEPVGRKTRHVGLG